MKEGLIDTLGSPSRGPNSAKLPIHYTSFGIKLLILGENKCLYLDICCSPSSQHRSAWSGTMSPETWDQGSYITTPSASITISVLQVHSENTSGRRKRGWEGRKGQGKE